MFYRFDLSNRLLMVLSWLALNFISMWHLYLCMWLLRLLQTSKCKLNNQRNFMSVVNNWFQTTDIRNREKINVKDSCDHWLLSIQKFDWLFAWIYNSVNYGKNNSTVVFLFTKKFTVKPDVLFCATLQCSNTVLA